MGKLTLLLVLAAVLGGSLITFNSNRLSNETARERGEVQHDLLAREAAHSGQSVVVNAMLNDNGFKEQLRFSQGDVADGRFTVDRYTAVPDGNGRRYEVAFTVTGHSGGATHTVNSRYEWDPMEFPGPLWLDVPFATAVINDRAEVDGGADGLASYFDPRLFNQLQLNTIGLDLGRDVQQPLGAQLGLADGNLVVTNLLAAGLLEDVNVPDGNALYYAAATAHVPGSDPTLAGPVTVDDRRQYRGNKIVLVTGDLTIGSSGRIEGDGALVVEGALRVQNGGQLDWDGLVIVHSESQLLPIELDGNVRVDGALVVSQLAFPPGGHMDFTVMRDVDGQWADPRGDLSGAPPPYYGRFAFQHTHRYDHEEGDRVVSFIRDGQRTDREPRTWFHDTLQQLDDQEVYLEFANHDAHGFARYTLGVAGEDEFHGTVAGGFPEEFQGASAHRTATFRASDLRTFTVDVRSLRALKQLFDNEAVDGQQCALWPICVGAESNRQRALTVRLKKASGEMLYEGALYWHMQEREVEQHLLEEQAWRERIRRGEAFGTALRMSQNVKLLFDIGPIETIGTRLGFDGPEVIHIGTWASHTSTDERGGLIPGGGDGGGDGGSDGGGDGGSDGGGGGGGGRLAVCHRGQQTIYVLPALLNGHLLHGDRLGACPRRGGDD